MAVDGPPARGELERRVAATVRDRTPTNWTVTESLESARGNRRPDVEINVQGPDGSRVTLVVEVKQSIERRDVPSVAAQARAMSRSAGEEAVPVVAARYLSPSVREALTEEGLSYMDATGNVRIVSDAPAMFIVDRGEDRDPWRKGRPRGTLKGEPAARVTRALLDFDREWRVRELITTSGASNGATYRVLDYLQREDLVTKNDDRYVVTDWERLLRQWSRDAPFPGDSHTARFIEPRGIETFLAKVAEDASTPFAVTGSVAAGEWATYAPAKAVYVYVTSIESAAETWGLRPNDAAPNVILVELESTDAVQFVNTVPARAGYRLAAPAQVASDLLNGPGREPAEGEFLILWMTDNEKTWRRG